MITRREFLSASVAGVGALALSELRLTAASAPPILGAQLYTVREQAEKGLPGVLASIAETGYTHVETYGGLYTRPAAELRKMIEDHGLAVPSGLFDYEELESRIEYAKTMGLRYVVCSILPRQMWDSADEYRKAAEQFNRWGEKTKQAGMRFAFHNHNVEFRDLGGTTGWDILVRDTDPDLVWFEMDCYWMTQAGLDPVNVLAKLGRRIRMLHLKDRKPGFPVSYELGPAAAHFTEVGAGSLNWKGIFSAAREAGVQYQFVERDSGDLPPIDSLRVSFANLRKLL